MSTFGTFDFSLDEYEVHRTRSLRRDTNYAVGYLLVNGKLWGEPQTKNMGRQGKGKYPLNMAWPNVPVQDDTTVQLSYQIMNIGNGDASKILAGIDAVARGKADAQPGGPNSEEGPSWAEELEKWLKRIIFANCDGPIAPPEGRNVVWHGWELKQAVPGAQNQEHNDERGNPSARGCGDNSFYTVYFSSWRH